MVRLGAEEGAARTTAELKAAAGTHSFSTVHKPMRSNTVGHTPSELALSTTTLLVQSF
jgi:hypothetical protein